MSLLFNVLFSTACKSTHHKLAMDGLLQLNGPNAELWRNLFLKNYESYLTGSKAPDDQFKDFKNHVLHVSDNFWGGAADATVQWFDKTVMALRDKAWADAIFAAGVCSHYYTDPLMPFHTGQSEEEGKVHRAAEWSITCAYDELRNIIGQKLGGYPAISVPSGPDWLRDMVRAGATTAHPHYWIIINHYNLAKGVKDPPAGLDQEIKDRVASCLAHATVGWARILEQAFAAANVEPPIVELSLTTVLASLKIPIKWVTKKMADAKERALVEKIYAEVQQTGKAIQSLPEDDKQVRELHASEVLNIPLQQLNAKPAGPTGQQYGTGTLTRTTSKRARAVPVKSTPTPLARKPFIAKVESAKPTVAKADVVKMDVVKFAAPLAEPKATVPATTLKFYLHLDSAIVDAPSIGAKTAERFAAIGVTTVRDLLELNVESAAAKLEVRWLDADNLRAIQAQARLACQVPQLRGHDAQILVACGITDPEVLANQDAGALMKDITPFLNSKEAERILRSGVKPDLEEVRDWIAWAKNARPLRAA